MTRLRWFGLLLVATSAAASACAPAFSARPAADGRLVIIGGGLDSDNQAVYGAILEARLGRAPLCVIPTASASSESSMRSAVERFERHGGAGAATGIFLPVDSLRLAHDRDIVRTLGACGGFFFTGGVQSRIVALLRRDGRATPALEMIMRRYRAGAVVAGSSAGAAIMSDPMIAGGSSAGAMSDGVRLTGDDDDEAGGGDAHVARAEDRASTGLHMHLLGAGDTFDLARRTATPAAGTMSCSSMPPRPDRRAVVLPGSASRCARDRAARATAARRAWRSSVVRPTRLHSRGSAAARPPHAPCSVSRATRATC